MCRFRRLLIVLAASILAGTHDVGAAEGTSAAPAKTLQVLVVAGGHGYPVKPFREVFAGYPDMDRTFVDETQGGEAFEDLSNWSYDAMVLYNYMKKPSEEQQATFLSLLDRGVGLVILPADSWTVSGALDYSRRSSRSDIPGRRWESHRQRSRADAWDWPVR